MKNLILSILLTTNIALILAIDSKRECSSRNDPHMTNFNNFNYEFQNLGQYCLYNSPVLNITAEFSQCWLNSAVTCNCMMRIQLTSTEFVEINTCSGTPVYSTDLGQALNCNQVIPLMTSVFDTNFWNSFTSNHNSFKCATTALNAFAFRTTLLNSADDLLVLVDQFSPNLINQIRVYPSDNYIINQGPAKDECLCGNYSSKLEQMDKEKCKNVLIDDCLISIIKTLEVKERVLIERLIEECVLDKRAMEKDRKQADGLQIGFFQKDILESSVIELLVKKYPGKKNQKLLQNILSKFCLCRGKKLGNIKNRISIFNENLSTSIFFLIIRY